MDEMKGLQHQWDHLTQETVQAEKELEKINNSVSDLLDQRVGVRYETWRMDLDLKSKREKLEQLKAEASGLGNTAPVVTSSVSGLSKGASAEPGSPSNKKKEE